MERYDTIIVGAGLAGLTTAFELSERGLSVLVVEKEKVIGGRTASWEEKGMLVESGLHRHIGYYKALPSILKKVGVNINDIVQWEEKIDILIHGRQPIILGLSPVYHPAAMIKGLLGNNHAIEFQDKFSLMPFLVTGFWRYIKNPEALDQYSVREYAKRYNVTENALNYMLIPLSTGIFFLPPERYSAKVFFGLFFPAMPYFYKMRVGAYLGGMTELLANPIARAIEKNGGIIKTSTCVNHLILDHERVCGVVLEDGKKFESTSVVLATNLGGAKSIIGQHFSNNPAFEHMLKLPTMPAITIQMEFSEPVLPYDRTTFGPLTALASFAEQSRSTFTHVPGRLSIILTPPEKFLDMADEAICQIIIKEAKKLGMNLASNLTDYRIVKHPEDFHSLSPHHDWMRPEQVTQINGLILAGDYTRQPFFATMEGAVISGMRAANLVLGYHDIPV